MIHKIKYKSLKQKVTIKLPTQCKNASNKNYAKNLYKHIFKADIIQDKC